MKYAYKIFVGRPETKRPLDDLDVRMRIISESIFKKQGGKSWTGFIWLGIGTSGGLL
jgi:hypothetical protein